jgi:hypothetical protein
LILLSLVCSSKPRYTWKRVDLWISRQFWMTFKEVHEYIVLISKCIWKECFIPFFLGKKRMPIRPLSPRNRYPLHLRATFVLALLVNNTKRTNTMVFFVNTWPFLNFSLCMCISFIRCLRPLMRRCAFGHVLQTSRTYKW